MRGKEAVFLWSGILAIAEAQHRIVCSHLLAICVCVWPGMGPTRVRTHIRGPGWQVPKDQAHLPLLFLRRYWGAGSNEEQPAHDPHCLYGCQLYLLHHSTCPVSLFSISVHHLDVSEHAVYLTPSLCPFL